MSVLISTRFLSVVGFVLSVYAVYVEYRVEHLSADEEFTALCDVPALGASCSAVFAMPVGKMLSYFGLVPHGHKFDVPNAALGILYYTWQFLFSFTTDKELKETTPIPLTDLTHIFTLAAFCSSVFLAFQLTFVIVELCVLCWTTHVINSILLYNMFRARKQNAAAQTSSSSSDSKKNK